MDCTQSAEEETKTPGLSLYVNVTYLATVTERLTLEENILVFDYKCTE